MGTAHQPAQVKLFCAITYAPSSDKILVMDTLTRMYGPIDQTYGPIQFTHTTYYGPEMGTNLQKEYCTFTNLVKRETLPAIKNVTNGLEIQSTAEGKRLINLDPGYINVDKLVLMSTKDFYHRLYLGEGIYGEVTLHFRSKICRYFSWTYPDYKEPGFCDFILKIREEYKLQTTSCKS